jgi:hypothetical protein
MKSMKNYITVMDPRLSNDTNADMRAMFKAHQHSPARKTGLRTTKRCNEICACIGMDEDTLNDFFALVDAEPVPAAATTGPASRPRDNGVDYATALVHCNMD